MKHAHIKYLAILAITHAYPLDWYRRDISVAIQAGMINVGIGRRLLRTAKIMRNERVIY